MDISRIQQERDIRLPADYIELLSSLADEIEYCFNDTPDELPEFEGRWWSFIGAKRLSDPVEILRVGSTPAHRQLELYMKMFQEFGGGDAVYSPTGEIAIDRVANGFVIAKENTDLLYLDPEDDFSVWIFYNDGYDVKHVAASIGEWLAVAKAG